MEFIITSLSGFALGILASWFFWKYLLWQKPNVVISDNISVEILPSTGKKEYNFKILNKGKGQVTDITFNAWVVELETVPEGEMTKGLIKLPINNTATATLAPESKKPDVWGLQPEMHFKTIPDFDIFELLKEKNNRVLVTLRCSDAISGTTIVQQKTYKPEKIIRGHFPVGSNLSVIKF